jgi:uncharacterized protein involved in outer membrane biogenesis
LTRTHRLIAWLLPVVFFAGFAGLSLLANAWLASSGGKGMLEKEFSSSLGYTVKLTGDYEISLFPWIAIEGSGIELYAPHARRLLARAEQYSAAIELLPFFHHEVQIEAIALRGGFLDLGVFLADNGSSADSAAPPVPIPQWGSLLVEDFSLVFSDQDDIVALKKLKIESFAVGHDATLGIEARWLSKGAEVAAAELLGLLQVGSASEWAKLTINDLQVKLRDAHVSGLSGTWMWRKSPAHLSGVVDWNTDASPLHAQLDLNLEGEMSAELVASYAPLPDSPAVQARVILTPGSDRLDFTGVNLQWNEQAITGAGCYWLGPSPGLHFDLSSRALDLDALSVFFPPGKAGEFDLPLDVSLELQVESANYLGAKAHNVEVNVGQERVCPDGVTPGA